MVYEAGPYGFSLYRQVTALADPHGPRHATGSGSQARGVMRHTLSSNDAEKEKINERRIEANQQPEVCV
jgi:hypothetical protein